MAESGYIEHLDEHPEIITRDIGFMRQYVGASTAVLDVGAGAGRFVLEAKRSGFDAVGLEIVSGTEDVWSRQHVPGVVADGFHLPFNDNSFSTVRMKEVIEHVEDSLALVKEAKRVLKPRGVLIAHVPTPASQFYPIGNFWDDYTHVRPYSKTGLRRLMNDAGYELLAIHGYTSGRSPVERLVGKALAMVAPHIYLVIARA